MSLMMMLRSWSKMKEAGEVNFTLLIPLLVISGLMRLFFFSLQRIKKRSANKSYLLHREVKTHQDIDALRVEKARLEEELAAVRRANSDTQTRIENEKLALEARTTEAERKVITTENEAVAAK